MVDRGKKKKSVSVVQGVLVFRGARVRGSDEHGEGRLSDCDRRLRDIGGGGGAEAGGIRIQAGADPGGDREKRRQDPDRDAG